METQGTSAPSHPILGSAMRGQKFELVLSSLENLEGEEQPFVILSDTGRFSRTFLARATIGTGTTLRYYALKIQRSSYRPYSSGISQEFPTNREVDEMWQRELTNLAASSGENLSQRLTLEEDRYQSRPIFFCKKTKQYFHPFCSTCFEGLTTCQEESLLRHWNLPSYEKSSERFLHCAKCATETSAVVYTLIRNSELRPAKGIDVRTRVDLFKDLSSAGEEQKSIFPCIEGECISLGENHVTPVSFHDFTMIPLELEQLQYDEWVDLVGGASWETVQKAIQEKSPGRAIALSSLQDTLSRPFQWMHRKSSSDLFAIEVMRLKMSAFLQLCQGVQEFHKNTGAPHLSLDPANTMVTLPPGGPDFPARWNARTRLIDLGSAHRFRPMARLKEFYGDIFIPSPDIDKTYASPSAQKGAMGQEEAMRITIQNISTTEKGAWIEIDALTTGPRLDNFCVRDLVHVVPTSPISWLEGVDLWGTVVEPLDKGFRLSVYAPELTGEPKSPSTVDGSVTFIRKLDLPCDTYSLGMLYFRTLLVNDQQDIHSVRDMLDKIITKVAGELEGTTNPGREFIATRFFWEIDANADRLKPNTLLYRGEDRNSTENVIPNHIWHDALILGFRLLSNIPGFSFCANHSDRNMEKPESLLEEITSEVGIMNTRLQVELFEREDRNREIAELCKELQEEITGRELSGA